jgi:hypothetical protein
MRARALLLGFALDAVLGHPARPAAAFPEPDANHLCVAARQPRDNREPVAALLELE